jgi:hypothetical protein
MRSVGIKCLLVLVLCALARSAAAQVPPVPLPPGARKLEIGRYTSPRGFRQTVEYYRKTLAKQGITAEITPVTKVRDVVYVRILPRDTTPSWTAIHLMLAEGKTTIYIVEPKN